MSLPPQPISVEDAGKLRAEAERLRFELEKLRLEVADLRRWKAKAMIAVISVFLAPVISIGTLVVTSSASRWKERKHNADALYDKVVQDFASPALPRRISAISAMEEFFAPQPSGAWWMLHPKAEQDASNERAQRAISLLVNSLDAETDPRVANTIVSATLTRVDLSLSLLQEANRRAAVEFARAAGTYIGLQILFIRKRAPIDYGDVPAVLMAKLELDLNDQLARSNQLFDNSHDSNTQFLARRFLHSQPYNHLYERQQHFALGSITVPGENEVGKAQAAVSQKALFLEATSKALVAALAMPATARDASRNWSDVAIVCGEFKDPVDFSNLDLHNAYLYASTSLNSGVFSGTKLQYADLTFFHVIHADLSGAEFEGMQSCRDFPSFGGLNSDKIHWIDKTDPRCQ